MSAIVRGTTPTIIYTFSTTPVDSISEAVLTVRQTTDRITKDLSEATVDTEAGTLSWTLTQAETLSLATKTRAIIYLDWLLDSGTRGAGVPQEVEILPPGVNEVMT